MASLGLSVMRCQCFMRIFLRFGVAGLYVVIKGKRFLDVLGLVCKAAFLDEKSMSVKIDSMNSRG